jgi:hypothetical protein
MRTVVLAAVLACSLGANAAVLCKGKSLSASILRVRTSCKANEIQIDPITLGLQGPPGPPGLAAVARDAADRLIGSVSNFRADEAHGALVTLAHVVADGISKPIVTYFGASGFNGGVDAPYFESSDCSGAPLVRSERPQDNAFDPTTLGFAIGSQVQDSPQSVAGNGARVYYADGAFEMKTVMSILLPAPTAGCSSQGWTFVPPAGCCTGAAPGPAFYAPAATIDVSGFVPPFRIDSQ